MARKADPNKRTEMLQADCRVLAFEGHAPARIIEVAEAASLGKETINPWGRPMRCLLIRIALVILLAAIPVSAGEKLDAAAIIRAGFHHYRGQASEADVEMVIHRPTWERAK
jgi:hypothetical protein